MSYSQNGEDLIISEYFGEFKGYLMDIGANDGITFSNSRLLIERGWKAYLIEPSLAYSKLSALYDGSEYQVQCLNFAIGKSDGVIPFYEVSDSLLSSTSKEVAEKWGRPITVREVKVIDASFVNNRGLSFINIDTEGEDWNILQQIDLTNVKCLCIEYGKHETLIARYCAQFGLKEMHRNAENIIFAI